MPAPSPRGLNQSRAENEFPAHRHHPGRNQRRFPQQAIEQEREVAISDLLENNFFRLEGSPAVPII
jgi:hypothetical protein